MASGTGHVRGIAAGHSFYLSGYHKAIANVEYVTVSATLLVENVSEDLQRAGSGSGLSVAALSDAQRLTGRWRVLVDFGVQPSSEALRPAGPGTRPFLAGVQTAVVCGPDSDTAASDLYTDGLGRVKVQFAWDRWGGAAELPHWDGDPKSLVQAAIGGVVRPQPSRPLFYNRG